MWWRWSARGGLVAVAFAATELLLASAFAPVMRSSLVGAAAVLHQSAVVYMIVLLPAVALAVLIERRGGARLSAFVDALDPVALLSQLVGVVAVVVVVLALASFAAGYPEFPRRMALVAASLAVAIAVAVMAAARWLLRPALAALASRWRPLGDPRLALPSLMAVLALAMLIAAYVAFGALLLPDLAALVATAAVTVAFAGAAVARSPAQPAKPARAGVGLVLVALLVAPLSSCRHPLGSYLFYNHALAAGALGAELGALADVDHDGALSIWLGGTDCAAFDVTRGPGRVEIPGDGVDQDCRGGDASPSEALTSAEAFGFGCEPPELQGALLIVLDAVRADAVRPATTPNLTALRGAALDFTRAYSPAASTIQSMAGLFSGRSLTSRLDPASSTLLHQVVRREATLTSILVGRRLFAVHNLGEASHFAAGLEPSFVWWLDAAPGSGKERFEAAAVTNETIRMLSATGAEPFFAWIHYTDAHAPYLPLESTLEGLSDYEKEVAYVDMHLGRLLAYLERSGMSQRVAVVVTADHGEELGARLVEGHGRYLYESSIHVPLLLRVPGCPPARVERPVSLTQIAPTLAALLGHAPWAPTLATPIEVVVETMDRDVSHRAVIGERFKLVVDVRHGGRALFDLDADPRETRDVQAEHPQAAAALEAAYQRFLDQGGRAVPVSSSGAGSGQRARR